MRMTVICWITAMALVFIGAAGFADPDTMKLWQVVLTIASVIWVGLFIYANRAWIEKLSENEERRKI